MSACAISGEGFWLFNYISKSLLGFKCANDVSEGYAILLTFSAAILTGVIAHFFSIRRDNAAFRNSNTDKFLIQNDDKILSSLNELSQELFGDDRHFIDHKKFGDKLKHWNVLFLHYERLAVAIRSEDLY